MFNSGYKAKAQYEANKDKNLSWDEWQELAPEGLEYMEGINPNQFSNLYQAEFKVIPNMGTLPTKETESVIPQVNQLINNVTAQVVNPNRNILITSKIPDHHIGKHFAAGDPIAYDTAADAQASVIRMNEHRVKSRIENSSRNILDRY